MEYFYSILIPAFKAKYLSATINSCLCQSYSNFEIIIVDDASPEDILGVVKSFNDERIHYYRNKANCGAVNVVDNWNICLDYANGDYVICMGDDDLLASCCLEDYNSIINKYPGLNVYHTRTLLIDDSSKVWQIQEQRPEYETGYSLWWHRWNGRGRQYMGDFLFLRQHLIDVGGFYKLPLAWASDDISTVRAALPKGIANVSRPGFMYRQSPITISMSASEQIKAEAACLEKDWYHEKLLIAKPDNDVDTLLVTLLKNEIDLHFKDKIFQSFLIDIYNHPFRFYFWYKNNCRFSISKSSIIFAFCKSMLRSFVRKCLFR